jgi:hypothetical protein
MNTYQTTHVTGSLYVNRGLVSENLLDWSGYKEISAATLEAKGWTRLTLNSREPLLGEPTESSQGHHYTYLIRQGDRGRFLMVSEHTELVTILLNRLGIASQVRPPEIRINDLAQLPHLEGRISGKSTC